MTESISEMLQNVRIRHQDMLNEVKKTTVSLVNWKKKVLLSLDQLRNEYNEGVDQKLQELTKLNTDFNQKMTKTEEEKAQEIEKRKRLSQLKLIVTEKCTEESEIVKKVQKMSSEKEKCINKCKIFQSKHEENQRKRENEKKKFDSNVSHFRKYLGFRIKKEGDIIRVVLSLLDEYHNTYEFGLKLHNNVWKVVDCKPLINYATLLEGLNVDNNLKDFLIGMRKLFKIHATTRTAML